MAKQDYKHVIQHVLMYLLVGLGNMPLVACIATLPVFTNSDGLPATLFLFMPNASVTNVEVANQLVSIEHYCYTANYLSIHAFNLFIYIYRLCNYI